MFRLFVLAPVILIDKSMWGNSEYCIAAMVLLLLVFQMRIFSTSGTVDEEATAVAEG
jgi:hypothetical protein